MAAFFIFLGVGLVGYCSYSFEYSTSGVFPYLAIQFEAFDEFRLPLFLERRFGRGLFLVEREGEVLERRSTTAFRRV
jgi:hypothetical protein